MKIILAPMEGLTDVYMRDVLTRIAGQNNFDWCVTEFIRVTNHLLPAHTFYQYCPELLNNGKTLAGTPVHIQLLGSEPLLLAENAARAAELGAVAIDLNFGCPAKTVNSHRGGAILLEEPETVHAIIAAVRKAVPSDIPVSAKMRLGVNDCSRMLDNAHAVESAGANWLTVHARTKADGYRPPAHWHVLAQIRQHIKIPIFANGDICNLNDAAKCRLDSQCDDLMIGRGAVIRPDFIRQLRGENIELRWAELLEWQLVFLDGMRNIEANPYHIDGKSVLKWTEQGVVGRYKQWLAMLTQGWPEAKLLFEQIKKERQCSEIRRIIEES